MISSIGEIGSVIRPNDPIIAASLVGEMAEDQISSFDLVGEWIGFFYSW
jgi:hypothetical protein